MGVTAVAVASDATDTEDTVREFDTQEQDDDDDDDNDDEMMMIMMTR